MIQNKEVIGQLIMGNIKRTETFMPIDKVYAFSNEDLRYIDPASCKGKKRALVVTGGGDHSLNLITNGIMEIDTFDINDLTEYYFALKRAMIMKYSFEEFSELVMIMAQQVNGDQLLDGTKPKKFTSNDIIWDIINEILSAKIMDEKYQEVWKYILEFYNKNMKGRSFLTDTILHKFEHGDNVLLFNNYLSSEAQYNLLKKRLPETKITYTHSDVMNIAKAFGGNMYDIVLLSNTLDYALEYADISFEEFIKLLDNICNPNAIQYLHYVFWYNFSQWSPILNAGVKYGGEIVSQYGVKVLKRISRKTL